MSYETVFHDTNYLSQGPPAFLWVYPNRYADLSNAEDVADALENAYVTLLTEGRISELKISIYDGYTQLDESEAIDYRDALGDYRNQEDLDDPGSHIVVTRDIDFAEAEHAGAGDTLYVTDKDAAIGTDTTEDEYLAGAVHETLHNGIRWDIDEIKDLTNYPERDTGHHLHEHDLGSLIDGELTPMATYHRDTDSVGNHVGDCSDEGWDWSWTTQLTECTKEAVTITADAEWF